MSISIGFDPNFLGEDFMIKVPRLIGQTKIDALNDGEMFHYTHFSLVMNNKRRFLVYGANNVDKNTMKNIRRGDDWHFCERIGVENQIGNELYRNNPWDRGHMVRRRDVCWGSIEEAKQANFDSFCWGNIVLQHGEINQGIWNQIENWILEHEDNYMKKISIFTGPIFTDQDREYCGVDQKLDCGIHIPAGFWKVMFYVNRKRKLRSLAFVIKQDDFWFNEYGKLFKTIENYQVPLNMISQITGIEFEDVLYETNPLFFWGNQFTFTNSISTPEFYSIRDKKDLVIMRER
ncbi:DNA/RNA non-specific endonuclease [Chengkuizengella axinellae]|uniref:DNA/RNA non-specific endonuclease n=1 Tax=Chengkuizengella axinellae TaxID=3064388 RepID=A0ABT9IW62_9BACL|nr:DNA/RNA non-specific endonuclease [Chengkuizengella sp. 2205SS18-9]MDP5273573.1 DNA/RNA non-specific endonuclease [Chengkuizengella sp. 2205SS18-9]